MTLEEASKAFGTVIETVGKHHKEIADKIAQNYSVRVEHDTDKQRSVIECTNAIEDQFCISEKRFEAACEELSNQLPFAVVPENFEF